MRKQRIQTAVRTNHGLKGTVEYGAWQNIKNRCLNSGHQYYHRYGGRGITVCDRWKLSFMDFLQDVGYRPTGKHSIHRVDNDGNYEPGNCIWATPKEQANQMCRNVFYEFGGKNKTITQIAEDVGIPYKTLRKRLMDLKWKFEDAISLPLSSSKYRNRI